MLNKQELEALLPYATAIQAETLRAIHEHGSYARAGDAIGRDKSNVRRNLLAVQARAAKYGYAPSHDMTRTVPDGYRVKGVSTLYNGDGEISAQWVKSDQDRERQAELMREVVEAMKEDVPREAPQQPPNATLEELSNLYVITDYHLGALSWHEETGADWDVKIAENLLVSWFSAAIAQSPESKVGILANIGDLLHWDGYEAATVASGHILDADTRFQNLVRIVIRVLRRVIRMLLGKHEQVHLIMADANHDPASEVWLREMFSALYDEEPRVTVDNGADSYYCFEWGQTSLFFHHGHKRKPESIHDVFAGKFRDVFGRTKHSYAHMGHQHHSHVKETNLMIVEQHRTLAAPDAYASRGGWLSGREASVITYHKEFGQVGRVTITPDMVAQ